MGEPTTTPGRTEQIAAALATANMLAGGLPLLIQSSALTIRMVVALFKHHGVDIGPFSDEIARMDAGLGSLQDAIDQFREIAADVRAAQAEPGDAPAGDVGAVPVV